MIATNQIKRVIAIASGKGGVGKSTVTVNLAFALKKMGHTVGLLDVDLYGPSFPLLLGISNETVVQHDAEKIMQPVMAYEVPTMSMGYLIDEKAPVIWRGPIASKMIQQLFYNTAWGNLDYLLIDLPPGTGDIHLTLAQKLGLQGVVMVTTPQSLSLTDVRKAVMMFQKVNVPLLGIIENMSVYQCDQCGNTAHLFGEGGGIALSKEYNTSLLAKLPIDYQMREQSDQGQPFSLVFPDSLISHTYNEIAKNLLLAVQKNKLRRFPNVVVEN